METFVESNSPPPVESKLLSRLVDHVAWHEGWISVRESRIRIEFLNDKYVFSSETNCPTEDFDSTNLNSVAGAKLNSLGSRYNSKPFAAASFYAA